MNSVEVGNPTQLCQPQQAGLTAIELAVVVAILAVLAGIVAGSVTGMNQSARSAAATTDTKEVQKAVDRWVGEQNASRYPVSTPLVVNGDNAVVGSATPAANGLPQPGSGLYVRVAFADSFTNPEGEAKKFVPDYLARVPKYGQDNPNPWVVDESGTAKLLATGVSASPTPTRTPTAIPTATPTPTPTVSGTWVTRAAMPTARRPGGVGVIDGRVYVAGGLNSNGHLSVVEAYDPVSNTWASKANMPVPGTGSVSGVIDGTLYVAGVDSPGATTDALYAYDPAAGPGGTWTTKMPLPEPRGSAAGGVIGGKLYVAGGWNSSGQPTATLYAYDPAAGPAGIWTTLAPMPDKRIDAAAAAVNGKLYVVGGSRAWLTDYIGVGYVYDPVANAWTSFANMSTPRVGLAAAAVNGMLYAIGGLRLDNIASATVEAYNPVTDTWSPQPALPTARTGLEAVSVGGTIYAIGGVNVVDRSENEAFTP